MLSGGEEEVEVGVQILKNSEIKLEKSEKNQEKSGKIGEKTGLLGEHGSITIPLRPRAQLVPST